MLLHLCIYFLPNLGFYWSILQTHHQAYKENHTQQICYFIFQWVGLLSLAVPLNLLFSNSPQHPVPKWLVFNLLYLCTKSVWEIGHSIIKWWLTGQKLFPMDTDMMNGWFMDTTHKLENKVFQLLQMHKCIKCKKLHRRCNTKCG